jgi:hypothetical protein
MIGSNGLRCIMTHESETIERVSLEWLGNEVDVEGDASGSRAIRRLVESLPTLRNGHSFATSSQARSRRVR